MNPSQDSDKVSDVSADWRSLPGFDNHEFVMALQDEASGLKAFVGIHSTSRGPALGGTRFKVYQSETEALTDVLNLSHAMSYKCAMANLPYGGGKAVIINTASLDRRAVLAAYAKLINQLRGLFKTGTDVGIADEDVQFMGQFTSHMLGVVAADRGQLTTSKTASLGVFSAMKAALKELYGDTDFSNRKIAIKGAGKLGGELARLITEAGGEVIISDIIEDQAKAVAERYDKVTVADNYHIHRQAVDIYAPCALGNEFTDITVHELNCRAIVGGANNQLANSTIGDTLHEKGIVYAPDYIANAGGLIYVADELEPGGFSVERVISRTQAIEQTMAEIFTLSKQQGRPTHAVADTIAQQRIGNPNVQSNSTPVDLFHKAAKELPAYKSFLKAHNVDAAAISDENFTSVPLSSKKNYLTQFPLKDLSWHDTANGAMLFCATSGSTGEPYYFPRDDRLSHQYSYLLENYIKQSSYGDGKTLVLIGFGMGVWIGGVFTLRAFEIAGQRLKTPLALLPTGYNKVEIFKALRKVAPQFDQTVIVGYPPFIKELVDEAAGEGIDLSKLHVRFLFAAESFTETFRNYVCEKAGVQNPLRDTLNIYGTADIGAMAYETPLSILLRRLVIEDPLLYQDVFGQIEKTPTVAQYNPDYIQFEAVENQVVLTADGVLPLIRYAVGDHGGVFDFEHIAAILNRHNVDIETEITKADLADVVNRSQPFVYVYERSDLSVTLHGINIYPEYIKEALLSSSLVPYFSERFTMSTKTDIHHTQFLLINLEMQKDVEVSEALALTALDEIRDSLIQRSSEFAEISKSRLANELMRIECWPNGHKRYFSPGTKQKWVEKA
jgi:glutamate dehydrogenase/leucine dehydrogenase/phenylacetate-coenzyme A ligase PaaK-like adenylate-forming protein